MKKILTIVLLMYFNSVFGQSLYEINFTGQGDTAHYKCLLVYYNENDSYARIAFFYRGLYRVVETKYKGTSGKYPDGRSYFSLTGNSTTYITTKTDSERYNPDYLLWIGNESKPYTTDRAPDANGQRTVYQVDSYFKLDVKNLKNSYLRQFYGSEEKDYLSFIKMNNDNLNNTFIGNNYSVTLHLITLANTLIYDIGQGCQADVLHLNDEFEGIAKTLKISFDPIVISGDSFSKNNLIYQLDNMTVHPNDIVIFVYRGHGFRWSDQKSPYPSLAITKAHSTPVSTENTILLEDIYNKVIQKGGRLNIVMGDCCNSDIGVNQWTNNNYLYMQSNASAQYSKLNDLFINRRGNLIFAASEAGEVSWTNATFGGFFTTSFLQALSEETSYLRQTESSWVDIVANTRSYALSKSNSCSSCTIQHAIFNNLITKAQ